MGAAIRRVALSTTGQVVVALLAGILLGVVEPALATSMQAFSDIFIKLIKMVIPPIAFLTIVIGIVAIGLASLMATMGYWFDWVRFAGAAYLVWLGIKLIRVDSKSGMRAGPGDTGRTILEAFKPGTAPPDNYYVIGVADADGRVLTVSPDADRSIMRSTPSGLY